MWWQKDKETLKLTTLFFSLRHTMERLSVCDGACELGLVSLWLSIYFIFIHFHFAKSVSCLAAMMTTRFCVLNNTYAYQVCFVPIYFELDSRSWMHWKLGLYSHLFFHTDTHTHRAAASALDMLVNACKQFFITSCVNIVYFAWHFYDISHRDFSFEICFLLRLLFSMGLCIYFVDALIDENIHKLWSLLLSRPSSSLWPHNQKLTHVFHPFIIASKK